MSGSVRGAPGYGRPYRDFMDTPQIMDLQSVIDRKLY